jgi:dTDP-4-dehydrorhamnose 3,5-epimerase
MKVTKTHIEGLVIIEPNIFKDDRGYFYESYNDRAFKAATGFTETFVQDNQAASSKNVLRGLHYQNNPYAQSKLIRALQGAIWDVAVDVRKNSPTYGQWYGIELTGDNNLQFLIPKGFAHGYSVLSETAVVFYKCDGFYNKEAEGGVFYADPALNIDWKIDLSQAIISEKDKVQPLLKDANNGF